MKNLRFEDPSFSADGKRVVLVSNYRTNGEGLNDVFVMRANGRSLERIVRSTVSEDGPTFSPDGTRVAFSRGSANAALMVVDADGSSRPSHLAELGGPSLSTGDADWQALP